MPIKTIEGKDDRDTLIRIRTNDALTESQKRELGERLSLMFALSGMVTVEIK